MLNFEFVSPTKIIFGKNTEENVGKILKDYNIKKVLLHYGMSSIHKTGLYDRVVKSLNSEGIQFVELGGVEPNPKIDMVRRGVNIAKEEGVELVLAVGGGSVIDSSKAIAAGVYADFDPWCFNAHTETVKKALPVGVILTISAAGSELSNSCVISNPETNIKNGFNSDLVRPLFAIMNPVLTYTVSKYQTACGVVDILMHTIERYLSDEECVGFADEMALGLIRSVLKAGLVVMKNSEDYEARSNLMLASSFSHNGLTGLGSKMYFTVHKLEHAVSGVYDSVAHAAGLSVLFPAWAIYTKDLFFEKWVKLGKEVLNITSSNDEEVVLSAINYFKEYFKMLEMPTSFTELGIDDEGIKKFAQHATKNDTVKVVAVKPLNEEEVLKILKIAK